MGNEIVLADLLDCFCVAPSGEGHWAPARPNLPQVTGRVFGGQMLGAAISALAASAPGKTVKPLSAMFPQEAPTDSTVDVAVRDLRDGRSYATRAVDVTLGDGASFEGGSAVDLIGTLHVLEDGDATALDLDVAATARRFGPSDPHRAITTAVTEHNITFHTTVDLTDWHLVQVAMPSLRHARAFAVEQVWNADGRLVASTTQESLVRIRG